jgi:hypothetical protein
VRAALVAVGGIMMGYAVLGALADPGIKPGGIVLFLAAVLVAHDALLLPLIIAAGALLARFAPRWAQRGIRAAAIVSLAVGVLALPLVLGFGRTADNPSILPLAYGHGLLLTLALIWATASASVAVTRHRTRRRHPAAHQTPADHTAPDHTAPDHTAPDHTAADQTSADDTASPTPDAGIPHQPKDCHG